VFVYVCCVVAFVRSLNSVCVLCVCFVCGACVLVLCVCVVCLLCVCVSVCDVHVFSL